MSNDEDNIYNLVHLAIPSGWTISTNNLIHIDLATINSLDEDALFWLIQIHFTSMIFAAHFFLNRGMNIYQIYVYVTGRLVERDGKYQGFRYELDFMITLKCRSNSRIIFSCGQQYDELDKLCQKTEALFMLIYKESGEIINNSNPKKIYQILDINE